MKSGNEWEVLSLPCIYTDEEGNEKALWEHKHTLEELYKLRDINPMVFQTQYMQNPTPLEGLMYSQGFRTYEVLPVDKYRVLNYTDSADTGGDYLCSINYAEYKFAIYVLSVLYTKKPMEYTEIEEAKQLTYDKVELARIFSTSGQAQNLIFFPKGWESKYPEFYRDVTSFMKEGRNKNDDAPDVIAGMVELFGKGGVKRDKEAIIHDFD